MTAVATATLPRLPLQPWLDAIGLDIVVSIGDGRFESGYGVIEVRTGVTRRQLQRYSRQGLTPEQADRIACAAGFHPLSVWGDAWAEAEQVWADYHREVRRG